MVGNGSRISADLCFSWTLTANPLDANSRDAEMTRDPGPREKALREMREARLAEIESASADVRRKERAAVKSAGVGKALVERIQEAAKKRGKPRKAKAKK